MNDTYQLPKEQYQILAAKQSRFVGRGDTSGLEREIDELVYALYGLTPEEIKIVEGVSK